jgi:hypothetical protein
VDSDGRPLHLCRAGFRIQVDVRPVAQPSITSTVDVAAARSRVNFAVIDPTKYRPPIFRPWNLVDESLFTTDSNAPTRSEQAAANILVPAVASDFKEEI